MRDLKITTLSTSDYDALVRLWDAAGLPHHPHGRDGRDAVNAQMALPNCKFLAIRELVAVMDQPRC